MSKLDLSRPYRTRGGNEASAFMAPDGFLYGWFFSGTIGRGKWSPDGTYWPQKSRFLPAPGCMQDLVNEPEKRTVKVWINVYPDTTEWVLHPSKEIADRRKSDSRIACIEREIAYTVGEGLEP